MTNTPNPFLPKRRLPVGIPSFEQVRREGYLYVDKTDTVWQLAHGTMFNYFSRPRRFGKSMLLDTFACYFEGKRELFDGLRIMQFETDWKKHAVVRLDLSNAGYKPQTLRQYFSNAFRRYEEQYQLTVDENINLADRLTRIFETAHAQTGLGVVVLIDEYDAPLLNTWGTPDHEECAAIYREVFAVLKSASLHERFVFITGVAKFTQLSLFSALNNLMILSFLPECATVCGITEQEMRDNFMPEIERMAALNKLTVEQTLVQLRDYYDGYHFSEEEWTGVYNPFSLIYALSTGRLGNYWVSSGATKLLWKFAENIDLDIRTYDGTFVTRTLLETNDVTSGNPLQFLYQTGYLTLQSADRMGYTLCIPNAEVREALFGFVLPALVKRAEGQVLTQQSQLYRQLGTLQIDDAMRTLQALIADAPYSNKRLASIDMEERYRFLIASTFHSVGQRTEVERMKSRGRIDIVTWTFDYIYVFELKLKKNGGLPAAVRQIGERDYAAPFKSDPEGRKVIALAVELDDEGKGILRWERVE